MGIINERKKYNLQNEMPGITGWAQVNGRDLVQIEEKAYLDSFYYENHSLFLDLEIIILTIIHVVTTKNVTH